MNVEIQLIALMCAFSCALLGIFLVLRRMAMLGDAISHSILLGIVLMFFVVRDLSSPWLIIAASAVGIISVYLIESLCRTKLIKEDAAIALVYSFLFSVAIILISMNTRRIHLDLDAVLLGELALAPFSRVYFDVFNFSLPLSFIVSFVTLAFNVIFLFTCFKELTISTFDPDLSSSLRLFPKVISFIFIGLVSITTVTSFQAAGSILVIAFMVGPPLCAYLIASTLKEMVIYSLLYASFSTIVGFQLALKFDLSIAGVIASCIGVCFLLTFSIKLMSTKFNKVSTN